MTIRADSFALTPKLYGPVAQYALRGRGSQLFPDRSGNARHLNAVVNTPLSAPDGYPDVCLNAGRIRGPVEPALWIPGDITLTLRACLRKTGARQFLVTENDGTAVAGPWCFLVETDGRIMAGVENAQQQAWTWWSDLTVKWGRWAFYSFRRDAAAGRWTVGVNGTYQTSAPMTATVPLDSTLPRIFVGGPDVGDAWTDGPLADVSIWDKRLTDAQLEALMLATKLDVSTRTAAFMPKLYAPVAQWPLDFSTSEALGLADVSGNGHHLAKVSLVSTPADKVPGALSPKGSSGAGSKLTAGVLGGPASTWAITGPITVVCRALFDGDTSRTQVLYQSNWYPYTGAPPVRNVPFTLATVGPNGQLLSYAQHGSYTADAPTFALVPPTGRWCWVSFRRAANGVLTVGVDLNFEDSAPLPMPGPTAPGVQLALMNSNDGIAPLAWGGQLADLAVYDHRLTDEELLPLYRAAMGK